MLFLAAQVENKRYIGKINLSRTIDNQKALVPFLMVLLEVQKSRNILLIS